MSRALYAWLILVASILSKANADDFVLVQAEDPSVCSVEGRVETHIYTEATQLFP